MLTRRLDGAPHKTMKAPDLWDKIGSKWEEHGDAIFEARRERAKKRKQQKHK